MASNIRDKVIFRTPQSFDERSEVASSCVRKLGIKIPAIVDDMNNSTERAYTGWPDRIYLIDRNGRVVLKTKPGPFGFDPSQLNPHLQRLTARTSL
jgi:type I thyroxine 5'-deiodinase